MLEKEKHIKELYYAHHRKDKLKHIGSDYENNLFSRVFSNVMFGNPKTKTFLDHLQKLTVLMIDSNLVIRNMWNYTVDKYYNKHNN